VKRDNFYEKKEFGSFSKFQKLLKSFDFLYSLVKKDEERVWRLVFRVVRGMSEEVV